MTLTLTITRLQSRLVHSNDLILGMREGKAYVIVEVLTDRVTVMKFDFNTRVLGFTKVGSSHRNTDPLRTSEILCQNVVTLLIEEVEVTGEQIIPKIELKTGIVLVSTLPSHAVVRILLLVDTRLSSCTEVIVIGSLCPLLLIEEALTNTVHLIDIVTYLSIAGAQLQVGEPFLG